MGEQSSICVQKNTILALTMIIFTMMMYLFSLKIKSLEICTTVANNDAIEIENVEDDITSENTKFAAVQVIEEVDEVDEVQEIKEIDEKDSQNSEKIIANASESVAPTEYLRVVNATSTAYCLCQKCCGKSAESAGYGVTASGYKIIPGTGAKVISVDPSVIPMGSKVYVENASGGWDYGYAIAADTGSAIIGTKVDLYMDTHEEALGWGRRNVKVYVIE